MCPLVPQRKILDIYSLFYLYLYYFSKEKKTLTLFLMLKNKIPTFHKHE